MLANVGPTTTIWSWTSDYIACITFRFCQSMVLQLSGPKTQQITHGTFFGSHQVTKHLWLVYHMRMPIEKGV